jgi:hypothetical protein
MLVDTKGLRSRIAIVNDGDNLERCLKAGKGTRRRPTTSTTDWWPVTKDLGRMLMSIRIIQLLARQRPLIIWSHRTEGRYLAPQKLSQDD